MRFWIILVFVSSLGSTVMLGAESRCLTVMTGLSATDVAVRGHALDDLEIQKKIKALVLTHSVLFSSYSFRNLVSQRMKLENMTLVSPQQMAFLTAEIWDAIVADFRKGAPGVWSDFLEPQLDLKIYAEYRGYTIDSMAKAAKAVKEVEDHPELKAAVLKFIGEGLPFYSPRILALQRSEMNKEKRKKSLGLFFLRTYGYLLGGIGTAVSAYQGSWEVSAALAAIVFGPEIFIKLSRAGSNIYRDFKLTDRLLSLTKSGVIEKPLLPAVPEASKDPVPTDVEREIFRLENSDPSLRADSFSAIESYGDEIEEAVKLMAYEVSLLHKRATQSKTPTDLKESLESLLSEESVATWDQVSNRLRGPLPPFQKYLRAGASEFERAHFNINRLKNRFDLYISALEKEDPSGPYKVSVEKRILELKALQNTLKQMGEFVSSEFEIFSQTRQNVTAFNNEMSLRVSTSGGSDLSQDDVQSLRQLQYLVKLLPGMPK